MQVVEKFVLQLEAQLIDRGVHIELSPEAADWLAERGYDEKMGARPLGRVIQESIKKPLAEELLFGRLQDGGRLTVDMEVKTDEKGVETADVQLDIQPLPKKERSAKSEPAEPEEATAD